MTAAGAFDAPSTFAFKQEKDDYPINDDDDDDDDDNDDDANSVSSLAQPSILDKNCIVDPKDEFLRLTSMVRRVYFSYLHKSVISNYNTCCQGKNKEISKSELKRFAGQMELCAVRASLEASLYRQSMLKMIADIKSSTQRSKVHKKLTMFLETPSNKADAAVQTSEDYTYAPSACHSTKPAKDVHIQSAFVTSNFDESLAPKESSREESKNLDERISALLSTESSGISARIEKKDKLACLPKKRDRRKTRVKLAIKKPVEVRRKREIRQNIAETLPVKVEEEPTVVEAASEKTEFDNNRMYNDMQDIFGNDEANTEPPRVEEESQDSLMQHLEDMFCESDDSSDLMTLIEKHSGVSKANVDSEIGKMCPEESIVDRPIMQKFSSTKDVGEKSSDDSGENTTTKRKLSFSSYKKMKKRAMGEPDSPPVEETSEERQVRKVKGIWFVERVHQVSRLKAKMMELSVTNYRKHGRVRQKFIELFGDSDEEEMMPESPIHIEEHLAACKERIAPWVVKHLMPFYTKGVIRDRLLFKTVAKHIADMLIIENTFPEEECVGAYVTDYFRNKTSIKTESDIYI